MVRSLGLVVAIVIALVWFARPPSSAERRIRPVNPAENLAAFAQRAHGVPVPAPAALPAGWQATVSDYYVGRPLRVGWVTPAGHYTEYAATAGHPGTFVADLTGHATAVGPVQLGGVRWEQYRSGSALSLVRQLPGGIVVLGTLRDTAGLGELGVLAAALRP